MLMVVLPPDLSSLVPPDFRHQDQRFHRAVTTIPWQAEIQEGSAGAA